MTRFLLVFTVATLAAVLPAWAQRWEFGTGAGAGIYNSQTVTNSRNQTAAASFSTGPAISAYLAQNLYRRFGGEIRYTWQRGGAKLESGTERATFAAQSHAIHYDVIYHFADAKSRIRPYLAAGGGAKFFQGTGAETVVQPLNSFAFLTQTGEWRPLLTVAGGLKIPLSPRFALRFEGRDYITPVPTEVIAPARGASLGGWLHDFLILAGIAIVF